MATSQLWWEQPKDVLYKDLFSTVRFLDQSQSIKNDLDLRHLKLYGNFDILGLGYNNYNKASTAGSVLNKISLNIVQNMCDTVMNKIAKNKPRVQFLTDMGQSSDQKKAKLLTRFIDGSFYGMGIYEKSQSVFLDSLIFGTGILKIYIENGKVCCERVFPNEVICDERQSRYGDPREMHQRKYVDRQVLMKMFPKFKRQIEALGSTNTPGTYITGSKNTTDQILVIESWRLPSNCDSDDGRHAIVIENATLFEEEYKKEYFPFVFLKWNERRLGFWGQGLAEQLTGLQVEINRLLRTIQLAMHLLGVPRIFVENGSKVVSQQINNDIGNIIRYTGAKPDFSVAASVHPELFNQLDRLYQRSYEIAGVSQLSAQAKKPPGLDAAVALREMNDIESERFVVVGQRYEQYFVEASKQIIALTRDLYEQDPEYSVKVKGKKFMEEIKWSEVNLEDDQYLMQPFPVSGLGNTPAGRLAMVQDLIKLGMIDRDSAQQLLDFPDLNKYMSVDLAGVQDIYTIIEKIIDDGEYYAPEPFQYLEFGVKKMTSEYLNAKNDKVEEPKLEMMRMWIATAQAMIDEKNAVAASQQQAAVAEQNPNAAVQSFGVPK